MTQLNYKASNIARAERESGKNFMAIWESLGEVPSFDNLFFLFAAGGGSEADFDELAKKGVREIMMAIAEGVGEAGFLGKPIAAADLRKKMEEVMASENPIQVSEVTGETAND